MPLAAFHSCMLILLLSLLPVTIASCSYAAACSVHPGVIATGLWKSSGPIAKIGSSLLANKNVPQVCISTSLHLCYCYYSFFLLCEKCYHDCLSVHLQGAATTIWACLSPTVMDEDRGAYLSNCGPVAPSATGMISDLRQEDVDDRQCPFKNMCDITCYALVCSIVWVFSSLDVLSSCNLWCISTVIIWIFCTYCVGADADGKLREAFWRAMEEQVNEAAAKL